MMRDALDRYYTPPDVAMRCVRWLSGIVDAPQTVMEPSVGGGAWVAAARQEWRPTVDVLDIDPGAAGLGMGDTSICADWLTVSPPVRYDLVLGNPPYRHAEAHVRHSIHHARCVAMLLRLGFLASQRRAKLFSEYPLAHVGVLPRRPSFSLNGKTDGSDYAMCVWIDGVSDTRLHWINDV